MSFNEDQKKLLAGPLNKAHVKPPAPGKYGEYIEGWRTIDEANRIFGFDGWTRETILLQETNCELVTLKGKDNSTYQQWRVGYLAKVRVEAGGIIREGTGFGQGQGKPEGVGDAIESAAKEAETDAMKRALMTFGNPFGLALYDKTKANVQDIVDVIDDAQWAELTTLISQTGTVVADVCRHYDIPSLKELPAIRFKGLRANLSAKLVQEKAA